MMTLLGWTMAQYAEAKAHYQRVADQPLEPNLKGARTLVHWWKTRRVDEPGEIRILEVSAELDWAWASKMMEAAMLEVFNAPYSSYRSGQSGDVQQDG